MTAGAQPPSALIGRLVRLRPLAKADYSVLFDWYNDPEVVAPFDRFEMDTWDSFVHAVESAAGDPTSTAPRYVVERIEGARLLGFVGHYLSHPVLTLTDVWYVLGDRAERGKGYGSEAVELLVDSLFQDSDRPRVGATCDVENVPSMKLLERLGFRLEGTLRQALFHHTKWHDVRIYGFTRSEWAARSK